ncbi:MAG: YopX family protein [Lactobacillus sp.]|jgi:uncharacterized phage protein (TIGR01671 family)|nr:YopX family protein [Lactobacillus sp.]MCI1971995.1 YopX family protein [Lactobacillus sp.]MCI2016162.1 YopX family protein [Lactobacillus sp.]MCI2036405.1 YopX family protein [Lactobacillus sp.]
MREIKFRAWDGEKMVEVAELHLNTKELLVDDEEWLSMHHSPLMQFNGLYDKNGREIYEGDVVRVQETMDGGRIVCLEAIATAVWNEERGCWGCEGEFSGHLADYALGTMLSLMGNCCEVIGNIYENPELLEVAEHE